MRIANSQRLFGMVLVSACHTDLGSASERSSGYCSRLWQFECAGGIHVDAHGFGRLEVQGGVYCVAHGFGLLEVLTRDASQLGALRIGDSFGELALLYNSPRKATVRAVRNCQLWTLTRLTLPAAATKPLRQR